MKRLAVAFAATLLLVIVPAGLAQAQAAEEDNQVIFCGRLTPEDCDLLNASQDAMLTLASGEASNIIEISIGGADSTAARPASLRLTSLSTFATTPETIERMAELSAMDPAELVADPALVAESMMLPLQVDTAQTGIIEFSPELADLVEARTGIDLPNELEYNTRMVDGVLYIRVADFAGLVPQITMFGDWIGIEMDAIMPLVLDSAAEKAEAGEAPADTEDLVEGMEPPGSAMTSAYVVMIEPGQEEAYASFLELVALRDTTIEGNEAAVYGMKMDVPRYFVSPVFAEHVRSMLVERGSTEADSSIWVPMVGASMALLFRNASAEVQQSVDLSNANTYDIDMALSWTLGGVNLRVDIAAENRSLDSVSAIPAPEDAFVPPLRLIMPLLSSLGG